MPYFTKVLPVSWFLAVAVCVNIKKAVKKFKLVGPHQVSSDEIDLKEIKQYKFFDSPDNIK